VIDPGHGGDEIGASNYGVVEKESNLELAFRVERLLADAGVRPLLTRRVDERAGMPAGPRPSGWPAQRLDLQARIDMANDEGAALFLSIHSNGSASAAERGIEVYYNGLRPFASENSRLAQLLLDGVMTELGAAGYSVANRGIKDDRCLRGFQGRCFPLFVLGPERVTNLEEARRRGGTQIDALGFGPGVEEIRSRPTQMPGALVELLFISSPEDAALLRLEAVRGAMARGLASGVLRYLELAPS
jgi:N-acetylmuramoyl-L-alanine amidase